MSEIEKPITYEDRKAQIAEKVKDALGDNTTAAALEAAAEAEKLADEHGDLQDWYTAEYDAVVLAHAGQYATDVEVTCNARDIVRRNQPEKFARLREIQKHIEKSNAKAQGMANAAHASVIEANLTNTLLWS